MKSLLLFDKLYEIALASFFISLCLGYPYFETCNCMLEVHLIAHVRINRGIVGGRNRTQAKATKTSFLFKNGTVIK